MNVAAIGRRRFLGSLLLAYPSILAAQGGKPGAKPVRVGILTSRSSDSGLAPRSFVAAMQELGWTEGGNIAYEFVFADGDETRLPALAAQLVARKPDLIVVQTHPEVRAVLDRTRTIPIVFGAANNPYPNLVKSLARPGGNVTGIANIGWELGGRRMQLLKETMPQVRRVGVLLSGLRGSSARELKLIEEAAGAGVEVVTATINDPGQIGAAIDSLASSRVQAIFATHVAVFRREQQAILEGAARHRIPVVGYRSDFAQHGALIAYGADLAEQARRCAHLADKVLRGMHPGDIPVEQPARFELAVNLNTAKALGIQIPQSILLQANRVIE